MAIYKILIFALFFLQTAICQTNFDVKFDFGETYSNSGSQDEEIVFTTNYDSCAESKKEITGATLFSAFVFCCIFYLPIFLIFIFYALRKRKKIKENNVKYKLLTVGDSALIYIVFMIALIIFSVFFSRAVDFSNNELGISLMFFVLILLYFSLFFLMFYLCKMKNIHFWFQIQLRKISYLYLVAFSFLCFLFAMAFNSIYTLLLLALKIKMPLDKMFRIIPDKPGALIIILAFFGVAVIAPIFEEILFRGIMFRALDEKMTFMKAAIISSFIFAFGHFDFYRFIPIFILGMIMAFLYKKTRTIYAPILFHIMVNSSALIATIVVKSVT